MHEIPETIKEHLQAFMKIAAEELPDKAMFKEMGAGNIVVKDVYDQLITAFQLEV